MAFKKESFFSLMGVLAVASVALAGDVTLTTNLPMPHGRYKNLSISGQATFGNNTAQSIAVGIGTANPTNITANDANPNVDLEITGSIRQDGWVDVGLENGWENYGGNFNSAGYFRDKNGIVHLKGLVRFGAVNTRLFTLPVGFRPARNELFAIMAHDGSSHTVSRVTVLSDGQVFIHDLGGAGWAFYCLDGITFRANGY
jgi:hypothetical protein